MFLNLKTHPTDSDFKSIFSFYWCWLSSCLWQVCTTFTCRVGEWVPLHYWQLACLPKHTIWKHHWKHRITSIRLIGSRPSVETTCHNVQTSMCALFSPCGASSSTHLHRHGSSCGIPRSSIDHLTPQLASKAAESFSWWDRDKCVYEQWWTTFS